MVQRIQAVQNETVTAARTITQRIGHLPFTFEFFLKPTSALTGPAERRMGREQVAGGRDLGRVR